eukprot:s80_g8.t1
MPWATLMVDGTVADRAAKVPPSPAESVRLPAIGALRRTSSLPAARRGAPWMTFEGRWPGLGMYPYV